MHRQQISMVSVLKRWTIEVPLNSPLCVHVAGGETRLLAADAVERVTVVLPLPPLLPLSPRLVLHPPLQLRHPLSFLLYHQAPCTKVQCTQ